MSILFAVIFVFFMTPFALAQAGGDLKKDTRVKEDLRKLWLEVQDAGSHRDRAALERLYADEFLFIHSTGGRENKTETINGILAISSRRPVPPPTFDELLVYGDLAVLRWPRDGQTSTTIYAKKDGRWQIVQIQSTRTPPERKAVKVDPKVLDSYVGKYEFVAGVFTITKEGDALAAQGAGRPRVILIPASETQFFVKSNEGEFTFYKDERGQVTHVVRRVGSCQESKGKKVD